MNMELIKNFSGLLNLLVFLVFVGSIAGVVWNSSTKGHMSTTSKLEIPVIIVACGFLLAVINEPNIMLNIGSESIKYICESFKIDGII